MTLTHSPRAFRTAAAALTALALAGLHGGCATIGRDFPAEQVSAIKTRDLVVTFDSNGHVRSYTYNSNFD